MTTPGRVVIRYPDITAQTPYKLFGDDTLESLARRILWSVANPENRALFVRNEEVARVLDINPYQPIPKPVQERRDAISRGEIRTPRGRARDCETPLAVLTQRAIDECARAYYQRARVKLKTSPRLHAHFRARLKLGDEFKAASMCAAELTRQRYFREKLSTHHSVMNRLFKKRVSSTFR